MSFEFRDLSLSYHLLIVSLPRTSQPISLETRNLKRGTRNSDLETRNSKLENLSNQSDDAADGVQVHLLVPVRRTFVEKL